MMDTAYKLGYIAVFGTVKVLSWSLGVSEIEETKTTVQSQSNVVRTHTIQTLDTSKCPHPESAKSLPPKPTIPVPRKPPTCENINYYHPSRKQSNRNTSFSRRRSTGCLRTLQTIPETEAVFNFQARPRAHSLPENVSRRHRVVRVSKTSQSASRQNKSSSQTQRYG